jgi:hypothetical protein
MFWKQFAAGLKALAGVPMRKLLFCQSGVTSRPARGKAPARLRVRPGRPTPAASGRFTADRARLGPPGLTSASDLYIGHVARPPAIEHRDVTLSATESRQQAQPGPLFLRPRRSGETLAQPGWAVTVGPLLASGLGRCQPFLEPASAGST